MILILHSTASTVQAASAGMGFLADGSLRGASPHENSVARAIRLLVQEVIANVRRLGQVDFLPLSAALKQIRMHLK